MSDKKYIGGLYFNHPRDKAPEFVLGSISIHKQKFLEGLDEFEVNDKGYINIDVLNGKENKPYCVLNEYKPKNVTIQDGDRTINSQDVPF